MGAGVPWSGAAAGWWIDRPSASPEPGIRLSRSSEPPPGRWIGLSKRQAAVGDDRAGRSWRPTRREVTGQRARAWTPCSSLLSELRIAKRIANCELRIGGCARLDVYTHIGSIQGAADHYSQFAIRNSQFAPVS